jgi:hypothetical protein
LDLAAGFDGFALTFIRADEKQFDAPLYVREVLRLTLDQDGSTAFSEGGLTCRARARKRV